MNYAIATGLVALGVLFIISAEKFAKQSKDNTSEHEHLQGLHARPWMFRTGGVLALVGGIATFFGVLK